MGRPIIFKGHDFVHRRQTWRDSAGHTRSLYARWRDNLKCWECCISGFGIAPHRWFSGYQTGAECEARIIAFRWGHGWKPLKTVPMLWDARTDELHPKHLRSREFQYDMFPLAVAA